MKKQKSKLLAAVLLLGLSSRLMAQEGYVQIEGGAIESPQAIAGMRGGVEYRGWDFSGGYWGTRDAKPDESQLIAEDMNLDTFSAELYRIIPIANALSLRLGGGVGYTMLDLSAPEDGDNDISYTAAGILDYKVHPHFGIGVFVKGFFFNTKTHRMTFGSHMETLSNGQDVEVVDEFHGYDSVNFNRMLAGLFVKYYF